MKIIRVCVLILFALQSTFLNLPLAAAQDASLSPKVCDLVRHLEIPEKSGFITEIFMPDRPKDGALLIVQDPHNNVKAQFATAEIYDHLVKNYGTLFPEGHPFVAMEGTPDAALDYSVLTKFPVPEIRRDVSEILVEEGRLDGTEYYKVNHNPDTEIVGIENPDLYFDNVTAFKRADRLKPNLTFKIEDLRKTLNELKRRAYSYFLKQLDQAIRSFENHPEKIREHFAALAQLAKIKSVSLERYPAYQTFKRLMELENAISKETLAGELSLLGIFESPFSFDSREAGRRFLDKLEQALVAVPHRENQMRETRKYAEFLRSSLELRAEEFFEDLEKIYADLTEALAQSEREKIIADHDRKLVLLEKMWNFEVTDVEYGYFKELRGVLEDTEYWKKLNSIFEEYLLPGRVTDHFYEISLILREAEKFYEAALARNQALLENTLSKMKSRNLAAGILVVGGFHAEGIAAMLRQRQMPYALIVPQVGLEEDQSLYWKTLSGEETKLEKLVRAYTAKAPSGWLEGSNLAVKAEALMLAVAALRNAGEDLSVLTPYRPELKNVALERLLDSAKFTEQGVEFSLASPAGEVVPVQIELKMRPDAPSGKKWQVNVNAPAQAKSLGGLSDELAGDMARALDGTKLGPVLKNTDFFIMRQGKDLFKVHVLATSEEVRKAIDKGVSSLDLKGTRNEKVFYYKELIGKESVELVRKEPGGQRQALQAARLIEGETSTAHIAAVNDLIAQLTASGNPHFQRTISGIQLLGQGGVGKVYKISFKEGPPLVIKIPVDLSKLELARKFEHESEMLRGAQTDLEGRPIEGVVKLFGSGTVEGTDIPYLVMEHLDGKEMKAYIDGETDWPTRMELAIKLARLIQAYHTSEQIHRDLKPENIIVTRGKDGALQLKLVDFGTAVQTDERGSFKSDEPGFFGTLSYASPEQVLGYLGQTAALSQPSDIYAVGSVLFELFSGLNPSTGSEDEDSPSMFQIASIGEGKVPRLDGKTVNKSFKKGVPPLVLVRGIIQIVSKARAHQPGERYQSAGELADDLQGLLEKISGEVQKVDRKASERLTRILDESSPLLAAATAEGRSMGTGEGIFTLGDVGFDDEPMPAAPVSAINTEKTAAEQKPAVSAAKESDAPVFGARAESDAKAISNISEALDHFITAINTGNLSGIPFLDGVQISKDNFRPIGDPGGMGAIYQLTLPGGDSYVIKIPFVFGSYYKPVGALEGFRRESEMLKLARGYGVVKLEAFGTIPGTRLPSLAGQQVPFMILEHIKGSSAKSFSTRDIPFGQKLTFLRQMTDAFAQFHQKGLIHRDIKPVNVMVREGFGTYEPVIIDLGLAFETSQVQKEAETATGRIGTLQYMSPEQADGEHKNVDQVSDVFSIGATIYEILAQKKLFDSEIEDDVLAMMAQGVGVPLKELSRKLKAQGISPKVVDALMALLKQAMAPERANRYQSAAELEEAFARIMSEFEASQGQSELKTQRFAPLEFPEEMFESVSPESSKASSLGAAATPEEIRDLKSILKMSGKYGSKALSANDPFTKIGEGAMGKVFKITFADGERVVVKMPKGERNYASVTLEGKKLEKAQKLPDGSLNPGVPRLLMKGATDFGVPFVMMEFVDGIDLGEGLMVKDKPGGKFRPKNLKAVTMESRLEMMVKLAERVFQFHQTGLIHRDLKPANVMLRKVMGEDGKMKRLEPVIADLGLAEEAAKMKEEKAGRQVGTYDYMSPEQARGDAPVMDARSDVYALGAMLFEMVTGTNPVPINEEEETLIRAISDSKEDLRKNYIREKLKRIIQGKPAPNASTFLRDSSSSFNAEVSFQESFLRELDRIVSKARATEPANRYQTAEEFRADLEKLLNDYRRSIGKEVPKQVEAPRAKTQATPQVAGSFAERLMAKVGGILSGKSLGAETKFEDRVKLAQEIVSSARALGSQETDRSTTRTVGSELFTVFTGQPAESALPASIFGVPMDLSALIDYAISGDLEWGEFNRLFDGYLKANNFTSAATAVSAPLVMTGTDATQVMATEGVVRGRVNQASLEQAQNLFNFVHSEKNSGLVFLPFTPALAEGLMNGEERGMGARRSGIFLVVPNAKEARDWAENHPNSYQRKAVAVIAYSKAGEMEVGLARLNPADIKNLKSRSSTQWRKMGVAGISNENITVGSPQFEVDLGESKRLAFDAKKYASDMNYAAAHALAATFLALSPKDQSQLGKMGFKQNPDGSFSLTEGLLSGLVEVIKAKRLVARMA